MLVWQLHKPFGLGESLKILVKGEATVAFCDSISVIDMTKNPVYHNRHISIKHHFIRAVIKNGEVDVKFCESKEQVFDIFTKALQRNKFK